MDTQTDKNKYMNNNTYSSDNFIESWTNAYAPSDLGP